MSAAAANKRNPASSIPTNFKLRHYPIPASRCKAATDGDVPPASSSAFAKRRATASFCGWTSSAAAALAGAECGRADAALGAAQLVVEGEQVLGQRGGRRAALGVQVPQLPVERCDSLEAAVKAAAGRAEPGQVVLLAPACASFDAFRDYEERGDRFRELVEGLG